MSFQATVLSSLPPPRIPQIQQNTNKRGISPYCKKKLYQDSGNMYDKGSRTLSGHLRDSCFGNIVFNFFFILHNMKILSILYTPLINDRVNFQEYNQSLSFMLFLLEILDCKLAHIVHISVINQWDMMSKGKNSEKSEQCKSDENSNSSFGNIWSSQVLA